MPVFVKNNTDFDLPYDYHTWPTELKDRSLQEEFLRVQYKVLTPAYDLERNGRIHQNLSGGADAYFIRTRALGKGGFG